MNKKLLVISIDSLVNEDLEIMQTMPAFREIIEQASIVHNVTSTYPTLTHSIHTSILTGCYPQHHKVIHNEQFLPYQRPMPWFEEAELCKAKPMPIFAQEAGRTVAYVYWPVTLGAKVDWNLHRGGIHAKTAGLLKTLRERATPGLFDEVYPYTAECFDMEDHYCGDDSFCCRSVSYLIKKYAPDVIYTHLVLIDHARHMCGVHGEHIGKCYAFLDREIQRILDALHETGLYDDTIIAICSDHGHLDIDRVVSVNRFLRDHGLQTADEAGNILSYEAYCHSCSLSAQIYVKDPARVEEVKQLLWDNRRLLGISEILSKQECISRYHTDGDYAFMIETDGRSSFSAMPNFPLITPTDNSDYRTSKATHGHQPERGPQPCFVVRNPFANGKVSIAHGKIVDQAPTLAALADIPMSGCDGSPIRELIDLCV